MKRLRLKVPGKLILAGEYAILEPHHEAIVVAVDRYVTATIQESLAGTLSLPGLGLNAVGWQETGGAIGFSVSDSRLHFVQRAMAAAHDYLRQQGQAVPVYSLTVESELDDPSGRKYGLGSSGAVVVAVVAAILNLADGPPSPTLLFKLGAVAHFQAQGSGSGIDVAASSFGGWLRYSSFQPEWLAGRLAEGLQPAQLAEADWPFFSATPLAPPSGLHLCVGWTGSPASTGPLIQQVQAFRLRNPDGYRRFLSESRAAVSHLVQAFAEGDCSAAIAGLARNRAALAWLGRQAEVPIETPALAELHRIAETLGGAGKPSGAGGGDCGAALLPSPEVLPSLRTAWQQAGIQPLSLQVAPTGAAVVEVAAM